MKLSTRTKLAWIAPVLLSLPLLGGSPEEEPSPTEKLIERGRESYEVHCSNCHGLAGKGDGELTGLLKIKPTDLTRIRLDHKGKFPWEELYGVIDGRTAVPGHGSTDMPIWGMSFQERGLDTNQEDLVRGRILQLLHFLDSIQVDKKGNPWGEQKGEKKKDVPAGTRK